MNGEERVQEARAAIFKRARFSDYGTLGSPGSLTALVNAFEHAIREEERGKFNALAEAVKRHRNALYGSDIAREVDADTAVLAILQDDAS